MMITTKGMTQGTPWTGVSTPRLRLQIQTSTMPATATAPTVSSVTLSGGALRPWARRREVRTTDTTAYSPTATISTIQPATGVMLPLTRSSMVLLETLMTPPTAPLSTSKT